MPDSVIITLKEGRDENELERAKATARREGGKIAHEYSLIKGFVAEFPNETAHSLKSNDHIKVEQDRLFRTQ